MLQELNLAKNSGYPSWILKFDNIFAEAKEHTIRSCILYRNQLDARRYFVHEHPWTARSWDLPEIRELSEGVRVMLVQTYQ